MNRRRIVFFLVLIFATGNLLAQQTTEVLIQEGNQYYRAKQYKQAEAAYAKAIKLEPDNATAKYNHAHALYQQGKSAEAAKEYEEIASYAQSTEWKNRAYYSRGIIYTNQKKLEQSIEAYKNALRNDPNDKEARENLQKALLELKRRKPNQQQQQKKQQQQSQSRMNPRDVDKNLDKLQKRQEELQKRMQKAKSQNQGGGQRDW